MKISRQNFVIEKTKTQDHTNAKRHSEVSNPGIFYLQVSSLSSRHILKFSYGGMIPETAFNYTVKTPFCSRLWQQTHKPYSFFHSFSYYLVRSRRQDTLQSPGQSALRFTGCVTGVDSHVKYITQSESYQLLPLLPGQFQLCCLYPSLHLDAHLLRGLPGLFTLTLQPLLHPGPATEVHCYLPARRNGSSKKAEEFVVYMDSKHLA